MASRYTSLAVYAVLLAVSAASWLVYELRGIESFPPVWIALVCIVANLFVWQFGLPAPRVGLISLERLLHVGLLLTFAPAVAASICAVASLAWPLVSRSYSQGSWRTAILRGIHNAGMTAGMMLIAGKLYLALGGEHPLASLTIVDLWPLIAMTLVLQVINIALMTLYFYFDGRSIQQIVTPIYALSDLIFVPAGVLAAVLYNSGNGATFALFLILMTVFVVSFSGLRRSLSVVAMQGDSLARLAQARRALSGARRIDELGERILRETRAMLRFEEFCLVVVERDAGLLDIRIHERQTARLPRQQQPLAAGLLGWVMEHGKSLLVEDWSSAAPELRARAVATDHAIGSLIVVPLRNDAGVIGLISVQSVRSRAYSDADRHLLEQLAEQTAVALADARAFEDLEDYRLRLEQRVAERTRELEATNQEKEQLIAALGERSRMLERESQEDPLTGIANRRQYLRRLHAEIEIARTTGRRMTLAIADLDRFKIVNDRLGHAIGDEVLRQSASIMRQMCRADDLVARIGGEEFAIIFTGLAREEAALRCDTLRRAVENHRWQALHPHLRVTLSMGLSEWAEGLDAEALQQLADQHLYEAKRAGRNRVA